MNADSKRELITEAIKEYRQKEFNSRRKRIYHDTDLLMKNYNILKQYADNAVYKLGQSYAEDNIVNDIQRDYSYLDPDEQAQRKCEYIESVLRSKIRTTIMLQHIEMALSILKDNANKDGNISKYDIFAEIYIGCKTFEELSAQYHCSDATLRRWKNEMLKKLGILLFGAEGLILWA